MRSNQFRLVDFVSVSSVIALIGVVLAPGFLQARASVRMVSCGETFRMLGMALNYYHECHGIFPPGRIWDPKQDHNPHDTGTALMLAPFLEYAAVYNGYNTHAGSWAVAANKTTRDTKLEVLLCPDDTHLTETASIDPSGEPTNIAFSLGSKAWATHSSAGKGTEPEGVFFDNSNVRDSDIVDGRSFTVFASEQLIDRPTRKGSPERTGECSGNEVEGKQFYQRSGTRWVSGGPSAGYFNARRRPNDATGDCFRGTPITGVGYLNKVPRSRHIGGVNVLFGDGQVRFIHNEIDLEVWQALNTRAGRETVDPNGL